MPDTTVAIIGAGIGGIYLAAELGMLGCKLRLHDTVDSWLPELADRQVLRTIEGPLGDTVPNVLYPNVTYTHGPIPKPQ